MKSLTFILISLASGAIAGVVLAGMNMLLVEPYIDKAIGFETNKAIAAGEHIDSIEQDSYRTWQKSASFVAGAILGMAYGSLLGIVYAFSRKALPFHGDDRKKAVFLSLVMCAVLFVVPFIKYPGNPPAVGNPETIYLRETLYLGMLAVSAISALCLGVLLYRLRGHTKHISLVVPLVYAAMVCAAFVLFPSNPDKIPIPVDLVNSFRVVSGLTMVVFWMALGVVFGMLWHKLKPHEPSKITSI